MIGQFFDTMIVVSIAKRRYAFIFFTTGEKWEKVECQMKKWKRNNLL